MPRRRSVALALGALLVAFPAAAQPSAMAEAAAALRLAQRAAVQYALLVVRSAVDLSYDSVSIDPRSGDMVVSGLEFRPRLDWDRARRCRIGIDRVTVPGAGIDGIDRIALEIGVEGVRLPPICLDPASALMVQSFGYEALVLDEAAVTLSYHLPSSGADLYLSASLAEAARLRLSARFDYLWLTGLDGATEGDAPPDLRPVAHLVEAEAILDDAGLWERVAPLVGSQIGGIEAAPGIVRALLGQALAGESGVPGPAAQAFIENAAVEIERFVRDGDRLVLGIAPEGGVWLEGDLLQTPGRAIEALAPRFSALPRATRAIVAPDALAAALAGGEGLEAAERLRIGRALMTGIGAPRAEAEGRALIAPLAEGWDPEAALLLAEARADSGEVEDAYAMTLRALAGAVPGATALAARVEPRLSVPALLRLQEEALAAWPGRAEWAAARDAAEAAGDMPRLIAMAADAAAGRVMPRSYTQAYYLAALGAAAGDRRAALIRDRIDARFRDARGAPVPAWAEARTAAAAAALDSWTRGGLAARVLAGR